MKKFLSKSLSSLTTKLKGSYTILAAEDYLINRRDSNAAKKPHEKQLFSLPGANHGDSNTDSVVLCGVPKGKIKEIDESFDTFSGLLTVHTPDLIFLQLDPCKYIARQRFLSHKCALQGEEDYHESGVDMIDPLKPYSWEECVVNLIVLDMLNQNEIFSKVNLREGFSTYSYPYHRQSSSKELTEPFIEFIKRNLLSREISPYLTITESLFTSLMGKQKVLLGAMPEPLLRIQVGNRISIEEMRDLFKFIIGKANEMNEVTGLREITMNLLPHIFQAPMDLYMTAMLKEAFQASTSIVAMVEMHHYSPMISYWEPPPHGINYTEATRVPPRVPGETDEEVIEKHAIMDVMLSSQVWGAPYLSNAFPYLIEDLSAVEESVYSGYKKCFAFNFAKYKAYASRHIRPSLDRSQVDTLKRLEH